MTSDRIKLAPFIEEGDALLAAIIESSDDAIISKDLHGTIRSWNAAAERIFGYTAAEAIGQPITLLAPPERHNELPDILDRIKNGQQVDHYETVRRKKDGELLYVSLTISPIRNQAGQVVGASKIARDITQRRRVEFELQQAKRQLEDILGSIRESFIAVDRNWQFTYANGRAVAKAGVSRDELIGRNLWEFMPEAKATVCWEHYHRVMQERSAEQFEVYFPSSERWYEVHAYPTEQGLSAILLDITDRYEAQEALRQSESQRKLITDSLPVLISYVDSQERYRFNNRTHESWLNIGLEDLAGRTIQEVIGDEAYSQLGPYVKAVLQGERQSFEACLPDGAGGTRHVSVNYVPDTGGNGEVRGFFAVLDDISERRRMEEALRQSQAQQQLERERLARVFEQAPVGIAVLRGEDLVYEIANGPYHEFVPNRPLLGRPLAKAIPEFHPEIATSMRDVLHTGQPTRLREIRVPLDRNQDGLLEDYWFDVLHHPLVEPDGQILSIVMIATDITAQVLASKEVQHQWRMFDAALSNTPDYIYIFDREGRFTYANRPFTKLFARPMDQIVGRSFSDLGYPPELSAKLMNQIEHVFGKTEAIWDETLFTGVDGVERSFEYIFTPICQEDGTVEAVAGSSRDITDRKRAVEVLRRSNEELRRTNRELEEFAFVASHDLQEPLRMVGAYTQLLLRRMGPKAEANLNQYAAFIGQGVTRMQELIQDLLVFSHTIHSERQPPGIADLGVSLNNALAALQTQVEESAALITADPMPLVSGDESQLSHVFQNLVSNSLKYRRRDRSPEIRITAHEENGQWVISVRDNGIGFEQQYAERIFGLFKRLHKDQYPGTGLGLAICQRIVERYGGRMWAEGALDVGSTFYFTLPGIRVNGN